MCVLCVTYEDMENVYSSLNMQAMSGNILLHPSYHIRFYSGSYIQYDLINDTNSPIYKSFKFKNEELITKIIIKYIT